MSASVTVYLLDDEPDVTRALSFMLASVGIAARSFNAPEEFLDCFRREDGAACFILDLRMPGASGIEVLETVNALRPDVPVTFLSAHGDIAIAVRTMKLGAFDFLQKPFEPQAFLDTVNRMMRTAHQRFAAREEQRRAAEKLTALSPRELEVMEQMVTGASSKEIGRILGISPKTVDVHRTNVLRKLGVSSNRELIRYAREPAHTPGQHLLHPTKRNV